MIDIDFALKLFFHKGFYQFQTECFPIMGIHFTWYADTIVTDR